MRITRFLSLFLLACLLAILPAAAQAQGFTCQSLFIDAMTQLSDNCAGAGSGQACYGYGTVQATTFSGSADFAVPSATIDLATTQTVEAVEMDLITEEYGAALLNVPTAGGLDIKLVVMGGVRVTNRVNAEGTTTPAQPVDVLVNSRSNLRAAPSTSSAIIGAVDAGETLRADGTDASGNWLRVGAARGAAWVSRSLVTGGDALPTVVDAAQLPFGALNLSVMPEDSLCRQGLNGLLIQTAPDAGEVTLNINGSPITVSGTVFLEASIARELQLTTLDGRAEAGNLVVPEGYTAAASMSVMGDEAETFPMMNVSGAWGSCNAIDTLIDNRLDGLEELTTDVLYTLVDVPKPGSPIACGTPDEYAASVTNVQQRARQAEINDACQTFAIVSPNAGIPESEVTFIWSAPTDLEGLSRYRLNVFGEKGDYVRGFTTGGTQLEINTASNEQGVGGPGMFLSFTVDALDSGGNVLCTTRPVRLRRDAPGENPFAED